MIATRLAPLVELRVTGAPPIEVGIDAFAVT